MPRPGDRYGPAARPSGRRHLVLAVKLLVSGGILYYILGIVPLAEIAAALRAVDLRFFVLGLALVPPAGLAAAAQQKVLTDLHRMRLSVGKLAELNLITRFYDFFLPGGVGSVVRWRRMARPTKQPAQALAALAFNRLLDTIVLVAFGLCFWFLARPAGVPAIVSVLLLGLLGGLLLAQLALFSRRFSGWACELLEASALRPVPAVVRSKLVKLLNAAAVYEALTARQLVYLVALGLGRHLLGVLGLVLFARAIGLDVPFAAAAWIHAFLAIALMFPFTVAGLGVREASLIVFLDAYGVAGAGAMALSMLLLSKKVLRAACGGVLEARHAFLEPGKRDEAAGHELRGAGG